MSISDLCPLSAIIGILGINLIVMPPLKKGAYCFATVGRSVCRSVGRSVCGSVDQVLSDQYLLTPSLDQYQTWCRGEPQ